MLKERLRPRELQEREDSVLILARVSTDKKKNKKIAMLIILSQVWHTKPFEYVPICWLIYHFFFNSSGIQNKNRSLCKNNHNFILDLNGEKLRGLVIRTDMMRDISNMTCKELSKRQLSSKTLSHYFSITYFQVKNINFPINKTALRLHNLLIWSARRIHSGQHSVYNLAN